MLRNLNLEEVRRTYTARTDNGDKICWSEEWRFYGRYKKRKTPILRIIHSDLSLADAASEIGRAHV